MSWIFLQFGNDIVIYRVCLILITFVIDLCFSVKKKKKCHEKPIKHYYLKLKYCLFYLMRKKELLKFTFCMHVAVDICVFCILFTIKQEDYLLYV